MVRSGFFSVAPVLTVSVSCPFDTIQTAHYVGELDARLEIVEDRKEEFREGVVYYLQQGRVRGVLLWNTWGQVDNARALIAEQKPFAPDSLRGRLPA